MNDPVEHLKARARKLHRAATTPGDDQPAAAARLRKLPELRDLDDDALAAAVQRRHALTALARELGFRGWPDVVAAFGPEPAADYGTWLYTGGGAYWNIWCASHDEAAAIRADHGGYLLAWRHQLLVVDRDYVTALGLDPDDPDWDRMGRDWVRPADPAARARLATLVLRRLVA